jgi:hypothetical protein
MTIIQPRPQGVSSADHLIRIIGEFIVQQDNKLMARIKALEERLDNFRDCGVWKEGEIYFDMNMVSHNGSFWLCKCRTQNKPGTDPVSLQNMAATVAMLTANVHRDGHHIGVTNHRDQTRTRVLSSTVCFGLLPDQRGKNARRWCG